MVHHSIFTLLRPLFICLDTNEGTAIHAVHQYRICSHFISSRVSATLYGLTEHTLPLPVSSSVLVGPFDSPSRSVLKFWWAIFRVNMRSPTFTYYRCSIVNLTNLRDEHVNDVSPRHTHTYKLKYRRSSCGTDHVGLTQTRPNKYHWSHWPRWAKLFRSYCEMLFNFEPHVSL